MEVVLLQDINGSRCETVRFDEVLIVEGAMSVNTCCQGHGALKAPRDHTRRSIHSPNRRVDMPLRSVTSVLRHNSDRVFPGQAPVLAVCMAAVLGWMKVTGVSRGVSAQRFVRLVAE